MKKRPYLTISILTIILSIIPYLIAIYLTPKGYHFTGFILDSTDNMTYISKMMGAREGWTFRNYYSPSLVDGGFIFLFYILIGKLALITGENYILWYHISRILLVILFCHVLYSFLKKFDFNERTRIIVYLLVLLGGTNEFIHGIGNLSLYGYTFRGTLDPAYVPFASTLYAPHFLLVMIFQISAWSKAVTWRGNYKQNSIKIGFYLLGIAIIHPFTSVLTGFLIGGFLLIEQIKAKEKIDKKFLNVLWFGAIPIPYLIYILWLFNSNTMVKEWNSQAIVEMPSLHTLLSFLGIPIMLVSVIVLTKWAWRKEMRIFSYWFVSTVVLSLIPSSFQGRLWEGIFIPIFVIIGCWISEKWATKKVMQVILISLMLLNTIWLVLEPVIVDKENHHRYISNEQVEAYVWLKKNKGTVLSDIINGNYIPVYSRNRVLLGHLDESPNSKVTVKSYKQWCEEKTKTLGGVERLADYILIDKKGDCRNPDLNVYNKVYENKQITIIKRHP